MSDNAITGSAPGKGLRQQILMLYSRSSALDSDVVGWAFYDGTGATLHYAGDQDEAPFATGLAAMQAGWRVLQVSQLQAAMPGAEYDTSYLPFEIMLEQMVGMDEGRG
jgi:hypothetical protein